MDIKVGTKVQDLDGIAYEVVEELGMGGQGETFRVCDPTGARRVLKMFAKPSNADRLRVDWLRRRELHRFTELVAGPIAVISDGKALGYVQPSLKGVTLDEHLLRGTYPFEERLWIAASLTRGLAVIESVGASHGDIAPTNVMVRELRAGLPVACLIDLDSMIVSGLPPSGFIGHDYYRAPELLENPNRIPNALSDRFSLGMVLHEWLLLFHPYSTFCAPGTSFAHYARLAQQGGWLADPKGGTRVKVGEPVEVLSPALEFHMRASLDRDAHSRSTPNDWAHALEEAIGSIVSCVRCKNTQVNHEHRTTCPYCAHITATIELVSGTSAVRIDEHETVLGRTTLHGANDAVSTEHVRVARHGVLLRVTDCSRNGTFLRRASEKTWTRLQPGQASLVAPRDSLKLGDKLELTVR
ncbi:MAG: hypothetical protein JNK05_11650 [Myxococcales bacterium]|nr:hypothetical protein [Myxococcales bacterium]